MDIGTNMTIEKLDLDYFLGSFLRSYLFYNKNVAPEKIVVPMIPAIKNYMTNEMIPVEFVEFKPEAVSPEEALTEPPEAVAKLSAVKLSSFNKEPKKRIPTGQDTA